MPSRPIARRVFDLAERAIGGPLESLVQTDAFADAFSTAINVETTLRRSSERFSRRLLHALNIPAGSDMRRLEVQLSRLERTLEAMRTSSELPPLPGEVILHDEEQ